MLKFSAMLRCYASWWRQVTDFLRSIPLQDVCLAIDDNFHLWDSGYVSIPYDFDVKTVVKEVTRLLAPVSAVPSTSSTNKAPAGEKVRAVHHLTCDYSLSCLVVRMYIWWSSAVSTRCVVGATSLRL